jgi:hypothetical protein
MGTAKAEGVKVLQPPDDRHLVSALRPSTRTAAIAAAAFLVLGSAATVLGLDLASQRVHAHLVAVAESTVDPVGLKRLSRGACPDATYLVRCGQTTQDADTVAQHYQVALSTAFGQAARSSCETRRFGAGARTCTVRVDSGDHTLMILIDSMVDVRDGRAELVGSRVRLDAE